MTTKSTKSESPHSPPGNLQDSPDPSLGQSPAGSEMKSRHYRLTRLTKILILAMSAIIVFLNWRSSTIIPDELVGEFHERNDYPFPAEQYCKLAFHANTLRTWRISKGLGEATTRFSNQFERISYRKFKCQWEKTHGIWFSNVSSSMVVATSGRNDDYMLRRFESDDCLSESARTPFFGYPWKLNVDKALRFAIAAKGGLSDIDSPVPGAKLFHLFGESSESWDWDFDGVAQTTCISGDGRFAAAVYRSFLAVYSVHDRMNLVARRIDDLPFGRCEVALWNIPKRGVLVVVARDLSGPSHNSSEFKCGWLINGKIEFTRSFSKKHNLYGFGFARDYPEFAFSNDKGVVKIVNALSMQCVLTLADRDWRAATYVGADDDLLLLGRDCYKIIPRRRLQNLYAAKL